MRQPMPLQPLPCHTTVGRLEQATPRSAARPSPSVNLDLPHPSKKNSRIVRVHPHVRAARVLVDKQHFVPSLSTINSAEDPALRLRPISVAQRASQHDVWIPRINL